MKFFQYLSSLFHLIGSKHFTTYFSQFFVQLMGRTLQRASCTGSEIMTTTLVAALYFGGNHADAIGFVKETGLMLTMVARVGSIGGCMLWLI